MLVFLNFFVFLKNIQRIETEEQQYKCREITIEA